MFERFILWLVAKFVSARALSQYYVDTRFIKDPSGHVEYLFHCAQSSDTKPKDFPSLPKVLLRQLHKRYSLAELAYLHALATIKNCIETCGVTGYTKQTIIDYLEKVCNIKESKNHLKVRKELIELTQNEFGYILSEDDVEALATILQQHHIEPSIAATFIVEEV